MGSNLIVVFFYFYLFIVCSDAQMFDDDDGFGTVFDGVYRGGQFEDLSTQAVLSLIKHIHVESEENSSGLIEIGADEVQAFHIPRDEGNVNNIQAGEFFF